MNSDHTGVHINFQKAAKFFANKTGIKNKLKLLIKNLLNMTFKYSFVEPFTPRIFEMGLKCQ